MPLKILLIVLALTMCNLSLAQESLETNPDDTLGAKNQEPYDAGKALRLSLLPTLGGLLLGGGLIATGAGYANSNLAITGFAVLSLGTSIGPGLGHFYNGSWARGIVMSSIRGAFCAAPWIYYHLKKRQLADDSSGNSLGDSIGDSIELAAGFFLWMTASTIAVSTLALIDCIGAYRGANRKNAEAAQKKKVAWSLSPLVAPTPGGNSYYGGSFALSF